MVHGLNDMDGYGFKEFYCMEMRERSIRRGCSHGLGIWADIFHGFLGHGIGMISSSWHSKVSRWHIDGFWDVVWVLN
jgi:hypothetical protein